MRKNKKEFVSDKFLPNKKTTMLLCGIGTDKKKLDRLKKALRNFRF